MAPVVLVWSGIARGCGGLWAFLTTRARGRARVDLEHERNQGTAQAIQLLPPGSELAEGDSLGWRRVIRIPDTRAQHHWHAAQPCLSHHMSFVHEQR